MLKPDANFRPRRWQRKPLRPFENYDGRLREEVLHAQRFEIVKALYAVQVAVKNRLGFTVGVKQREGRAGDIFFAGCAECAYDTLGQRSFSASQVAGTKYQRRRFPPRTTFPPPPR